MVKMMNKPSIEPLKIAIKAIQEQHEKEKRWEKSFDEMLDGKFICCPSETILSALIKVLEVIYRDEKEQLISWWMYEKDFGRKKDFNIYDNGGIVPTNTIEDLYNYLIKYHFDDDETNYDNLIDYIKKSNENTIVVPCNESPKENPFIITCNK